MAGVAAVTTDAGSASEVVLDGVTGLVVRQDAEAVADGLIRLLDADLAGRMGGAARYRAESEFTTGRLVADHERLYNRLVAAAEEDSGGADAG